jgi:hypothetical protein
MQAPNTHSIKWNIQMLALNVMRQTAPQAGYLRMDVILKKGSV